ncbi:MAG: P-loop NTPase [Eubacteriales bacterium]
MTKKEKSCNNNCSSCSANCDSRNRENNMSAVLNPLSNIKKCIGIVSGKGGVGKSLITSMAAIVSSRRNFKTAILDADITGPSIPRIFGVKSGVSGTGEGMYPLKSTVGIKIMSVNLLLDNETQPVVWRGPVIAGVVKQFWTDVIWGDVDYMFVDMPPGTGDVPLTVFQSIKPDGIIIVTTPQELVSMIVSKAVKMARMMHVPVLGIVQNMSYVLCPDCGKKLNIFGESQIEEIAAEFNLEILARIPLDPKLSALCDKGMLEMMENNYMESALTIIEKKLKQ